MSYRDTICELLDEIESKIGEIINNCERVDYSMQEIANELKDLKLKLY